MIVQIDPAGLRQTKWYEYVLRFVFGGAITAAAGLIGKEWGPGIAGLFLAFPAILPASATLLEKHEKERKQGSAGRHDGITAAASDATGAAMGSVGLFAFAAICWLLIPRYSPVLVLIGATLLWALVAGSVWFLQKRLRARARRVPGGARPTSERDRQVDSDARR